MNREEYRAKEAALLDQWKTVSNQLREIERQRRELKAEYFADNALAIGQAVIYRWKEKGGHIQPPLNGQICHVYEVWENYAGTMHYHIRKAKKDGSIAKSGPTALYAPADQLEVIE